MSGYPKNNSNPTPQSNESQPEVDVVEILKRVQQQLVYLEKKIDTLIAQRPVQQESRPTFQSDRPFRPYNRPSSGTPRPYGRPSSGAPRPYGRPSSGAPRPYGGGGDDRGNRSSEGRPERPYRPGGFNKGGQGGGFAPKKPFYKKREH